jgi:hypothetical protein
VVEETALSHVEACDHFHIFRAEVYVEDVEVLFNALLAHGLRDGYDTALGQPSEDDLRNALVVLLSDRDEGFVLEDVVLALSERCPALVLDAVLLEEPLGFDLLVERVGLDLIAAFGCSALRDFNTPSTLAARRVTVGGSCGSGAKGGETALKRVRRIRFGPDRGNGRPGGSYSVGRRRNGSPGAARQPAAGFKPDSCK